ERVLTFEGAATEAHRSLALRQVALPSSFGSAHRHSSLPLSFLGRCSSQVAASLLRLPLVKADIHHPSLFPHPQARPSSKTTRHRARGKGTVATNPEPNAPWRRIGMVLLVVAVGLAAGVGAVAFAARGDGPRHRRASPSVSRFRFPTHGTIGAATAAAVPPPSLPGSGRAAVEAFLGAERAADSTSAFG